MISTATIDLVRDLPIEQVIGKYVQLKPAGVALKACCPLHDEKTPSFTVSKAKNIFKCFGCGNGGDGIRFVMLHDNLSFIEAVRSIADQHGIVIEETAQTGKTPEQVDDEAIMYQVLELAQKKYHVMLRQPEATDQLRYLRYERNLSRETIIDWQIGLCPDWKVITPELINTGRYTQAEKCGVLRSDNGNVYDYFHHRITIPIHDVRGELIGFGGRVMKDAEGAKYFNPPNSPLYNKSTTLFGLDKARKHFKEHGMAVLVEGYFDVIKLHQRGWDNTVGTCGTALTEGQAKQLKRFTDTVLVLRDGDKAGLKAMERDIPILAAQQFTIYLAVLPGDEDPDSLFDNPPKALGVLSTFQDGISYLGSKYALEGQESPTAMAAAIDRAVRLLALITNQTRREQYLKLFCTIFKIKANEFTKPLEKFYKEEMARAVATEKDPEDSLPPWVDKRDLFEKGFAQLSDHTKGFKAGIYFLNDTRALHRVTNFIIKPLYHIYEQSNNRRLVEVNNTMRSSVVELPSQALTNKMVFENELINKGYYHCDYSFGQREFKRLTGWLGSEMPIAFELKTLGWQPEGFFAYSNAVWHDSKLLDYDELGMIKIDDKYYISMGNSKIHRDERLTDNPYENDLYLKYVKPKAEINFSEWADLFATTYAENAPYGIAYVFLTVFKDIVTRVAKMPMLYCYGPKGSGKSQMAESITWLFFSGKNGEGDLIKGYNLNPGQGTPFSFFNRVERFRNCPILMNEFDENNIEDWKFGTFKAAYDGEGREVGDGDTGKKRKTKIQKVQGTIILVGQYLSIRDDGSVLSRSISCPFSLERLGNLSPEEMQAHEYLKVREAAGLSSLITELLQHRAEVQKRIGKEFSEVQSRLTAETRAEGHRIEARLISNYSLSITATKIITDLGMKLPYEYETFYEKAKAKAIAHNKMLKDNNSIHQFWKGIEFLFDTSAIGVSNCILIATESSVKIKIGDGSPEPFRFVEPTEVLYVRFSNLYAIYSKYHRERSGKQAPGEETLLMYMKEQSYYIGLVPVVSFPDKRTSAYAFNYSKMNELGIVLEKDNHNKVERAESAPPPPHAPVAVQDDLPF